MAAKNIIYKTVGGQSLKFGECTGKLQHIPNLSTSPAMNLNCLARVKNSDSICANCYAFKSIKVFPNLAKMLKVNSEILSSELIPKFKTSTIYFRFESFGDIINTQYHLQNFLNVCNWNKHTKFALWTKHITSVEKYLSKVGKPENLQLVYSSPILNKQTNIDKFKFVDKVFTVYSKDFADKNNIGINCFAKCFGCGLCYEKNEVKYINEIIKSDQKKGKK